MIQKPATPNERIEELIQAVNLALEARGSTDRVCYTGTTTSAGLDRYKAGTDPKKNGVIDSYTGQMKKREMIAYLETMLKAIYLTP